MAEIVLELSQWAIPLFLILAPLYALFKGVDVYNDSDRGFQRQWGYAVGFGLAGALG